MPPQKRSDFAGTNLPLSHGQDKNRRGFFPSAPKADAHNSKVFWQKSTLFEGPPQNMHPNPRGSNPAGLRDLGKDGANQSKFDFCVAG